MQRLIFMRRKRVLLQWPHTRDLLSIPGLPRLSRFSETLLPPACESSPVVIRSPLRGASTGEEEKLHWELFLGSYGIVARSRAGRLIIVFIVHTTTSIYWRAHSLVSYFERYRSLILS